MAAIADLSHCIQCISFQAMGKVTATLNVQEQVTWPNLTNLTDREWDDILDMPVILEASVLHWS